MKTPTDAERLQDMIAEATALTQKAALSLATSPAETRSAALELTERALKASIVERLGDAPIGAQWLQSSMVAIRELIAQIKLSGGAAGGRGEGHAGGSAATSA